MNLIEQLGGYEKAKEIAFDPLHRQMTHVSNDGCHWVNEDFSYIPEIQEQIPTMIRIKDIRKALIEYRREHGIYDEGDWIIYKGELMVFALWSECAKNYAYIGYTDAEEGRLAHKDKFRHATPEEIKAGHRL